MIDEWLDHLRDHGSLLHGRRPDPSLPAIVVIPGFMGVHLAARGRGRVWLDLGAAMIGDIAEQITLDESGELPLPGFVPLEAARLLDMIYGPAIRRFRSEGFAVYPFPYDFRKSLQDAARLLAERLRALSEAEPGRRFVLVGHSMGGVVASLYPRYDEDWQRRVVATVLIGAPIRGTYDVVEAITGTHWIVNHIARASNNDSVREYQRALRTFPGMIELLPDPWEHPEAEVLYHAANWPEDIRPSQEHLNNALITKEALRDSPLLRPAPPLPQPIPAAPPPRDHLQVLAQQVAAFVAPPSSPLSTFPEAPPPPVLARPYRTVALCSFAYRTVTRLANGSSPPIVAGPRLARGDGTVLARSAAPPGIRSHEVRFPHSLMPRDPWAVQAIMDIARSGAASLPDADVEAAAHRSFATPMPPELEFSEGIAASMLDWLDEGAWPPPPF